jgi:hypothetical protein
MSFEYLAASFLKSVATHLTYLHKSRRHVRLG